MNGLMNSLINGLMNGFPDIEWMNDLMNSLMNGFFSYWMNEFALKKIASRCIGFGELRVMWRGEGP